MYRSLFQINGKRGFAPKSFLNEYKVLRRDLSHEVPVYKFNDKINKIQSEKLESTEENSTLLKDKVSQDDNKTPPLKSIDESTIEESHAINTDSISPSYEVIDGTTVYFENNPSVQPSFVAEVAQATALPNEQVAPDSEIGIDHKELSSNKNIFINNKELQPDTNDASSKLEGIKLSVDTQKQTNSDVTPENPEAIISSTLDTVIEDGISELDESSKSKEELSKNVEHTEKLKSAEENVEDNKKEKVTEHVESDGIFASITKTFSILSNMEEIVATESATTKSSDDTATPEIAAESNLQLEERVPENIGIKDAVTEKTFPLTEIKLESSVDESFIDKEKVETQQEIVHEDIESAKISNEKIKEASTRRISLGNITSPSDVPLSNNFVRENADKPAKELPIAPPILADDSSASAKADVDSHVENIKIQETNNTEKNTENIRTDGTVTHKEESTILSNLQETIATKTTTTQSSDDIEQKLAESETYLENIQKDADYKETIDQADKIVIAEHPETISLPSFKETEENIATESFPESHSVGENIAITEQALNQSAADIQFNKESIVHSNVNDNLVNDTISDNVPIESNEFSNDVKSSILGQEQPIDSNQENMISEQTMTFNEEKVLKKRDLSNSEENLEHKDSKLIN